MRPSHLSRRALLRGGFVLLALALIARGLSSDHLVKPTDRRRTDLRSRHGLPEVLFHVVLVLERVLIDARTCALARGARRVRRLATVPLLLRLLLRMLHLADGRPRLEGVHVRVVSGLGLDDPILPATHATQWIARFAVRARPMLSVARLHLVLRVVSTPEAVPRRPNLLLLRRGCASMSAVCQRHCACACTCATCAT